MVSLVIGLASRFAGGLPSVGGLTQVRQRNAHLPTVAWAAPAAVVLYFALGMIACALRTEQAPVRERESR